MSGQNIDITRDLEYRELCQALHGVATRLLVYRTRWRETHKKDGEHPLSLGMFDTWQELIVYCLVIGRHLGAPPVELATSMLDMVKHCIQEHLGIPMGVDDEPEGPTKEVQHEGERPDTVVGFGPGDCIACAISKSFAAAPPDLPVASLLSNAVIATLVCVHAVGGEQLLSALCEDHNNWEHRRVAMAPGGQA